MSLPIVLPGQVYLHRELEDYLVVTRATRGEIVYRGPAASGRRDIREFLQSFDPVDPVDLTPAERAQLTELAGAELRVGWTGPIDGEDDE